MFINIKTNILPQVQRPVYNHDDIITEEQHPVEIHPENQTQPNDRVLRSRKQLYQSKSRFHCSVKITGMT